MRLTKLAPYVLLALALSACGGKPEKPAEVARPAMTREEQRAAMEQTMRNNCLQKQDTTACQYVLSLEDGRDAAKADAERKRKIAMIDLGYDPTIATGN